MLFRNNFTVSPFSRLSSNTRLLISVVVNLYKTGAVLCLILQLEGLRATSSAGIHQRDLIGFKERK